MVTDTTEHTREVTERLRATGPLSVDGQEIGLAPDEAVCPRCNLAYFVGERAFDWGTCPDCLAEALVPVQADGPLPPGGTPPSS